MDHALLQLYLRLLTGVLLGLGLGKALPQSVADWLGQLLFWVGVPISILAFLRRADLSGAVWIAPLVGWVAILFGLALAWLWLRWQLRQASSVDKAGWSLPRQGSFLLAAMVGNTGYIGYPVSLSLAGTQYFGWAIFYDLIGTTLGAYGLGTALASHFGHQPTTANTTLSAKAWLRAMVLKNPALWSFGVGYSSRSLDLPLWLESSLTTIAWFSVGLSLVLTGMRLSQLRTWSHLKPASFSILIKMVVVPLVIGLALTGLGFTGLPRQVIVLQMGMPPAFATLVLAEAYHLDHNLMVTTLAIGTIALLGTLPLWLWLFGDAATAVL